MGYNVAAIFVVLTLGLAWFLGWRAGKIPFLRSQRGRIGLNVSGTIILAIVGVGRLGWIIQSWSGDTPAEQWNRLIFFVGSFVGLLAVLTARALEWIYPGERP